MPGRQLPAEWAPQGAVLLIWPHDRSDWADRLDRAERAFAALALAITRFQSLVVVCRDPRVRRRALERLTATGCQRAAISTVIIDTDDTWARDIAPIAVRDGELVLLVDFGFNGWGGKYRHDHDSAFGRALIDSPGFAHVGYERAPLVLEAGAVDSDGAGTLLVNAATVLDPERNPGLDAATAEALLGRHLGAERVLWLEVPALPGDDTDGHVDMLARFCGPETIAHAAAHDGDDPGAATHRALRDQLGALRTRAGEPYRLVPLPGPEPVRDDRGGLLPASYANFVVLNDAVLVPAFVDPADGVAAERLQALFPERVVVPVPTRTFIEQFGGPHCLTACLPEGVLEDLALS